MVFCSESARFWNHSPKKNMKIIWMKPQFLWQTRISLLRTGYSLMIGRVGWAQWTSQLWYGQITRQIQKVQSIRVETCVYIPRPSKGVKFQPPGLFLVGKGLKFQPFFRIQVTFFWKQTMTCLQKMFAQDASKNVSKSRNLTVLLYQYRRVFSPKAKFTSTLDGRIPANRLRLVVYPIIYKVLYIQTVVSLGISAPLWWSRSTVARISTKPSSRGSSFGGFGGW